MEAGKLKRTEILCPDCFRGQLIEAKEKQLYCERCGVEFVYSRPESTSVRYKEDEEGR